jgi:hypothetical protein
MQNLSDIKHFLEETEMSEVWDVSALLSVYDELIGLDYTESID